MEVYPRYLLMFVPLFNIVFWYVYEELRQEGSKWPAVPRWIYTVIGVALVLALFAVPFIERVHQLDHFYFAWASVLSLALIAAWGILADPARVLLWTVAVVLVVRIGLNLFILPFRAEEARFGFSREHAERVVARYPDRTWYLYKGTTPNNTARFYLENETRQIIQRTYDIDSGGVYLVYRPQFPEVPVAAKKDSVLLSAHDYLEVCVFDQ